MEEDIAGVLGLRDASAGEPPMGEDSSASAGIAVGVLRVRSSSSPKMQPGLNATGSPMHWNAFSFSPCVVAGVLGLPNDIQSLQDPQSQALHLQNNWGQ